MAKDYFWVSDPASGGVNTKDDPRELRDNESPYILNMDIKNKGRVVCRTGYELWGEVAGVTDGGRGLLPYNRTYGSNAGEYLLSFFGDGKAYYSTAAAPTPVEISSFGTDSGSVRGIVFNNLAIYGNGLAANTPQKWAGTGASSSLGGTPPDAKVWGQINHALMAASTDAPTTLKWSDIDNPDAWASGIASNSTVGLGDGSDITWIGSCNDTPIAFKERAKYPVEITFSTSDVLVRFSFKEKKDSSGGCVATGSVQNVATPNGESIYYLAEDGFQAYGVVPNVASVNNPTSLSYKINPTARRINFAYVDKINSEKWDDKYICLVPFEASQSNDYGFVYSMEFQAWTIYNGMNFADIKRFRDSNAREMLIAQSANEAKLYKFNNNFSDNGFGYERSFTSKTFSFGNRVKWEWLDLVGSKTIGSIIYVQINVDGRTELYKIDDDNLTKGAGGGYIGDNWLGDSYAGGGFPGDAVPMFDFRARVAIKTIQYGSEFKFKIYNSLDGEGFSLRGYGYKVQGLNDAVASTSNETGIAYAKLFNE